MKSVGNIASDSEVVKTASGAITAGKPVIVNSDGTVGLITTGDAITVYNAGTTSAQSVATNGSGTVVIAYRDDGNSNKGTAIVGTISSGAITFGSEVVFEDGSVTGGYDNTVHVVYDAANAKFVILYYDGDNSNYPTAIVGTVSGTSISFGTAVVIDSNVGVDISGVYDSTAEKIVVPFYGYSTALTQAVVGTVSGTSISFGSRTQISSKRPLYLCAAYDSNADKTVVAFRDSADTNDGFALVCTVSGTSISAGSETNFSSEDAQYIAMDFDSSANKVVIVYQVSQSGATFLAGKAIVGTVSGTSISFGTAAAFETGVNASGVYAGNPSIAYDSTNNKHIIAFDQSDANLKRYIGTVSGTSISFDTAVTLLSGNKGYIKSDYDSGTDTAIVVATDYANSQYGTAVIVGSGTFSATTTNLTSENFIGFAKDAVADGAVATIQTANSIARDNIQDTTTSDTLGSEVALGQNIAAEDSTSMVFDSSNNKVVVFYVNSSSGESTTVVGTVSDNSISFGTPATFTDAQYSVNAVSCVFDSNENKVVFAYVDTGDSNQGKAVVGTVSGTSISFGSEVEFESGRPYTLRGTFDSNSNRVVFVYRDSNNSNYFTSVVGSVSGTSISFGTPVVIVSAYYNYWDITFDSNSNKVVVALKGASSHGQSYVGTVDSSDNSISWGSVATFHSSANPRYIGATFDTNANKVVFSYMADDDSDKGYAVVGTVSGTDISFGTPAKFEDAAVKYTSIVFNSATNKVVVVYEDDANSDYTTYAVGTVSGTDISFATPVVVSENDANENTSIVFDSNSNKVVMQYGHSSDAKFRVLDVAGADTDLTIGQQYFVQTDGTLSTSADDPSVIAGTAISGTDLIVKG